MQPITFRDKDGKLRLRTVRAPRYSPEIERDSRIEVAPLPIQGPGGACSDVADRRRYIRLRDARALAGTWEPVLTVPATRGDCDPERVNESDLDGCKNYWRGLIGSYLCARGPGSVTWRNYELFQKLKQTTCEVSAVSVTDTAWTTTCSQALWGASHRARSAARRKLAKVL